jgi:DNA topoisomerase-1
MKTIIVVESPTKAKTIQKIVGSSYSVLATMGHVNDIPANPKKGGIGVEVTSITPPQVVFPEGMPVLPNKHSVVSRLRKACKGAKVILASDPDREGETIAWNVKNLLLQQTPSMRPQEMYRMTFTSITPEAIQKALHNLRSIDENLVDAWKARRCTDRFLGYVFSPIASNALGMRGISVGRVQTAVLSLVMDRENEIKNFKPEPRYTILLKDTQGNVYRSNTFKNKKNAERLLEFINKAMKYSKLVVTTVQENEMKERPLPPFKTSTLQASSSRLLGMSPKETMKAAQRLFEEFHAITYHRSDSVRTEPGTWKNFMAFATTAWPNLFPQKQNVYKNKGLTQDAHECIHPNYFNEDYSPDNIQKTLLREGKKMTQKEWQLYHMIWSRFAGSQAKPALWHKTTVCLGIDGNEKLQSLLSLSGKNLIFSGFRSIDWTAQKSKETEIIGKVSVGDSATGKSELETKFTQPPALYTEETLLKQMEKEGIGRPATYATAIETIFNRNYVQKDNKKHIVTTPVGHNVIAWSREICPSLADTRYTAYMEETLDKVAENKEEWQKVVVNMTEGVIAPAFQKSQAMTSGKYTVPNGASYAPKKKYPKKKYYSKNKNKKKIQKQTRMSEPPLSL